MSYLSGILCDVRHNRRKVYLSADSVHKKLAGATTVLLPRISPSELFLKKNTVKYLCLSPTVENQTKKAIKNFYQYNIILEL